MQIILVWKPRIIRKININMKLNFEKDANKKYVKLVYKY